MAQHHNRLVLFFDNLEAVQNTRTRAATNTPLYRSWINAAQSQTENGLILLLDLAQVPPRLAGSRIIIRSPGLNYGDFLASAQVVGLPRRFLPPARAPAPGLNETLHGNGRWAGVPRRRGLPGHGCGAGSYLSGKAGPGASRKSRRIWRRMSSLAGCIPQSRRPLERLPCLHIPVPLEGKLFTFALDLPEPERLLANLLAVSLVERLYYPSWQVHEFQLPGLVIDWLVHRRECTPGSRKMGFSGRISIVPVPARALYP